MASTKDQKIKSIIHDCNKHSLRLSQEPWPKPSSTQYIVRVHAVGITKGELQWPEPHELPANTAVPGFDIAGVIIQAPSPKSRYQAGERVYTMTAADRPANAREVTLIEEREIAKIPKNLGFIEAAAVPMSAFTAAEALFERGDLVYEEASPANRNRSVLIIGASGAVGIWATQLAKWAGVGRIIGVCGSKNVDFVKSLGAHAVIDHSRDSLEDFITSGGEDGKFDIVLDGVGGKMLIEAWKATKIGGFLFCIVGPIEGTRPESGVSEDVHASFFILQTLGSRLDKISALIENGHVKPFVDSVFAFEDFQEAFDRVETGRARGKVVLEVIRS